MTMVVRFLDTMPRDQCPLHGSVSAEDRHKSRAGHCLNCGACIYAFSGREWVPGAAALPVVSPALVAAPRNGVSQVLL